MKYKYIQMLKVILCIFAFNIQIYAQQSNNLQVYSHKNCQIVTNPKTGLNAYPSWAVFPKAQTSFRKVILEFTMACPDTMRCADWDYLDHIYIERVKGVKGDSLHYEIARMLTPYGGAFNKKWNFKWQVDVSDFAPFLHDSVEINYIHSGYESCTDRGWKISLNFICTPGIPPAQQYFLIKNCDGNFLYGDSTQDIEKFLKPQLFFTPADNSYVRMRIYQTGHGMNPSDDCGEFCSRWRSIWIDSTCIDKKDIWKKCGSNSLFPQAGTWIYNRANWCPGELNQPDVYDYNVIRAGKHFADINMQPYIDSGSKAHESISSYIFIYGKPFKKNDVSIDEIIVPSNELRYSRINPSTFYPIIQIRNNGSENLKSIKFEITMNQVKHFWIWNGNVSFNKIENIIIPIAIKPKNNVFSVKAIKVNNADDEYPKDNILQSKFKPAEVLNDTLILCLLTNNEASQNELIVKDNKGRKYLEHLKGTLKNATYYWDTLCLPESGYSIYLSDSAGDGTEFWYNVNGGRGNMKLLNIKGELLHDFESDFGNEIEYQFWVSKNAKPLVVLKPSIGLFPTRTLGKTFLDFYSSIEKAISVKVYGDDGKTLIEEHNYPPARMANLPFDFSNRPPQRYYIKVFIEGEEVFSKRVRVVDKLN